MKKFLSIFTAASMLLLALVFYLHYDRMQLPR